MPREVRHLFVAHVSHLDRRSLVTLVAPMPVIAAQPFAVAAVIANKNIGLKMRAKHVESSARLGIRKLHTFRVCVNGKISQWTDGQSRSMHFIPIHTATIPPMTLAIA